MKKTYKIEVDCAVCAAKIESGISKLEDVNSVSINFMTQKMIIDINDDVYDEVFTKAIKLANKIEPDFSVIK